MGVSAKVKILRQNQAFSSAFIPMALTAIIIWINYMFTRPEK